MSNRAYLCASNTDTIYPSFAQKNYDAPKQTIATDVECLPLLWLALFREGDLRRKTFKVDGDEVPAFAPACSKEKALKQLDEALPYLNSILPKLGRLDDYVAMFRAAVSQAPYKFVSIELEEIAGLYPVEHRFDEVLTLALRGFAPPHKVEFQCDDVVIDLSDIDVSFDSMDDDLDDDERAELQFQGKAFDDPEPGDESMTISGFKAETHAQLLGHVATLRETPLPSVRMYLDDLDYTEDQQWNFTRVLGAGQHGSMGFGREVPWEKEDADFGFEFVSFSDDDEDEDFDDDDE